MHPDEVPIAEIDVAFVCLPHGQAAPLVEVLVEQSRCRVIDLSADLRLRDSALHARVYGSTRGARVAEAAVYGITELYRGALCDARVVSNPGCYPTCAGLALWPLAEHGLLRERVTINALSGISGAGRATTPSTHFCAVADDVRPYKLGRSHRHSAEIEQILADAAPAGEQAPPVVFCPHVVPLERGMLATITVRVGELTAGEVHELFERRYADETFVELLPLGEPARIRAVVRTNRAQIGVHDVEGSDDVVLTCAIDNLVKGASGQALQTMNLMLGRAEHSGFAPTEHARLPRSSAPAAARRSACR